MLPTITFFGRELSTYTMMAVIGILTAIFFAEKNAKRLGADEREIAPLLLVSGIGIFLGGHLLYGLTNFDKIIYLFQHLGQIDGLQMLIDSLIYIFGGQVFYGGLIGGLIAGCIYLKIKKMSVATYAYVVAPVIPLFHTFGRIGCFLGGCCYGIEMPGGITFHDSPIPPANDVPRLPIQLIESGLNFALFLVLYYLQRKGKCKNNLMFIYLMSYAAIRFIDEFFRGDAYRGFLGPFSTSQIVSLILLVFSLVMILYIHRRSVRSSH